MKSKTQELSAVGFGAWIPASYRGEQFGIGFGCTLPQDATLTYSVQHSFSDPANQIKCSITAAGTTATITFPTAHNLNDDDTVTLNGSRTAGFTGTYAVVNVASTTTVTITIASTTATEDVWVTPMVVFNHDTVAAQTVEADGGYVLPPSAVRTVITAYTDGFLSTTFHFLSS